MLMKSCVERIGLRTAVKLLVYYCTQLIFSMVFNFSVTSGYIPTFAVHFLFGLLEGIGEYSLEEFKACEFSVLSAIYCILLPG
ncbi:hypothetical protein Patl1_36393 [Pistacia atlantica]|nr:hypothetical protein Patl1_36393 [Pistacia atlantica]